MTHQSLILNPVCVECLASSKSTSPTTDCDGWLVRMQSARGSRLPVLECCWYVLRGNLLMYCDDPDSPPKGLVVLENQCIELFDNFESFELSAVLPKQNDAAVVTNKNGQSHSSLKDYFALLSIKASSGDHHVKKNHKLLLSDISLASTAMQHSFRIFFPDSPTQEPLVLIADSEQTLQKWMRAIALASHAARKILASSQPQEVLVDIDQGSAAENGQKIVSSDKSFNAIHDEIRQIVTSPPVQ